MESYQHRGLKCIFPQRLKHKAHLGVKENTTQKQENEKILVSFSKVSKAPQEYEVDRMVRHRGRGQNRHYVVKWYGYGLEDDSLEVT